MSSTITVRNINSRILDGLRSHPDLLHFIIGPRQVGKTTCAIQIEKAWEGPVVHAAADHPLPPGHEWIRTKMEHALNKMEKGKVTLLVLDEIQKVSEWSEAIKTIWDERLRKKSPIALLALGSSSLLLQKGLSESLAGRFMLYRFSHWDYPEMKSLFGWDLDHWIFHGGYPGAGRFAGSYETWSSYITDSLIETVLARDILQMQTVAKPALLRHLFALSASYPAQIFSYNKMLGQLQDAGNTTTLAHYLKLLESAFLISGLELFREGNRVKKGSSPKLVVWNNALISAFHRMDYDRVREDGEGWGHLVENAVGAHLLNHLGGFGYQLFYWRHGNDEVDYVIKTPRESVVLEVKSSRMRRTSGLKAFLKIYPKARPFIVGPGGLELEDFFSKTPIESLGL
ncbi:MAG: AAA family ATPase [Fibrobacterota bacterium]